MSDDFQERIKANAAKVNAMWARRYPNGRDPARMAPVLTVLKASWESYPDLRLGQLILNAVGHTDLHNIEDDELLRLLLSYYPADPAGVPETTIKVQPTCHCRAGENREPKYHHYDCPMYEREG